MARDTVVALAAVLALAGGCSLIRDFDQFEVVEDAGTDASTDASADSGSDASTCVPTQEVCNGADDDCDTNVDEAPIAACSLPNATATTCTAGACAVVTCAADYGDCTATEGCETDWRSDHFRCGSCTLSCATTQACVSSTCRTYTADRAVFFESSAAAPTVVEHVSSTGIAYLAVSFKPALKLNSTNTTDPAYAAAAGNQDALVVGIAANGSWSGLDLRFVASTGAYVYVRALSTDASGNLYIAGAYSGGSITIPGGSLPYPSGTPGLEGFLVSYTSSGTFRWARTINGLGNQDVVHAFVSSANKVYVAGPWNTEIRTAGVNRAGVLTSGYFVAIYGTDSNGFDQDVGVYDIKGLYDESGIAVDSMGRVFLGGKLEGTAMLGADSYSGSFQPLVVALDDQLDLRWSRFYKDSMDYGGEEFAFDLTADATGNVYFSAGNIVGLDFGDGLQPKGTYLVSLDSSGALRWRKTIAIPGGSTSPVASLSEVSVGPDGNVYVTGYVVQTASTPTFDLGGGALVPGGSTDVAVVSYAADGVYRWARLFGGVDAEQGSYVGVGSDGSIHLTGNHWGAVTFDSLGSHSPVDASGNATFNGNAFYLHLAQSP